ncbi:MAG: hypothetical protein A3H57_03280 [Candidatus Taylorbacteria bacterium RIFCSPLOWO2_02_FULL_43_11]|uniref:Nudix hydrolase domain-containing protein n=1 Tax=Candidatus Taylorbacteria bacterium RIFCSPHIGHO2_02_FULL_43_32b TaxID=1802306 RepID=A0A1G2MI01_9BACT|nr:MAG: hypothetical protein A2743_00800 [Candidatus Taylorbacteria bacterium RIFCSPHIGHO2_01_FULL_43_47]OHA22661.1 MAG: hypothetical protein A3C72_01225 [Candidatus Taylorbacteria bacterium RIFCSPHIGHO2_02_FULL_43_32b]OHA29622.1 MAG: hypothetical protein A3B08_03330 [Candidatus Taylorbacteria bacterium RIFCSPLOWO2_01_FULL_43_44]OHA36127.1 MAG: hypothetical protein A3H57_03280 [Candidatus Taylorbacteria bacterium RIFCSPLOWO2_02_FULL_43_11]
MEWENPDSKKESFTASVSKVGNSRGKIDGDESPRDAIIRELREETGIVGVKPKLVGKFFVKYSEFDFTYTISN